MALVNDAVSLGGLELLYHRSLNGGDISAHLAVSHLPPHLGHRARHGVTDAGQEWRARVKSLELPRWDVPTRAPV